MNNVTNGNGTNSAASAQRDEDALLETALRDSDGLLQQSLREDDRRRRWRRLLFFTVIGGVTVMGTALLAALAGLLTLTPPPPDAGPDVDRQAWVARLTGLRDHMHTAFGVGPELTMLDPDEGLAIVREAWPKIKSPDVKTGLLKTFAFSKGLPEKHSKVLFVLNLGMRDKDPAVQQYAAAYVKEYSGRDFAKNRAAYSAWYRESRDKNPNDLLRAHEGKGAVAKTSAEAPLTGDAAVERADQLSTEGWALWQQQKFAKAAEVFAEASKLDPDAPNVWNGLGWARFNSGDSERAVEAFEKCVELERNHPAALNGLGQIYLTWGDFDRAEKFLKRAAPNAPAAWFGLSRLYLLTGKYDEAEKWIKKAMAEQPGDASLQQMLEAAQKKELPEPLRKMIAPIGKPQKSAEGEAAAEGWRQFSQGNFRAAERSFNRALAKDPENLAAMNGLGFILVNSGKPAEAKKYFERYLEIEPDAPGPMNGLARCLKDEGKVEEAITLWEKMQKMYPGPTAATTGLAFSYLERKEFDKALPNFEELVKAQPDNAEFKKGLEAARAGAKK